MEILPGVHGIDCRSRVWAYLYRSGARWILIDAGFPGDLDLIQEAMRSLDARISHIGQVILTHCHVDHMGTVAQVQAQADAQTLVHRLDAPIVRGVASVPDPVLSEQERRLIEQLQVDGAGPAEPARVDRELEDGDQIQLGDDEAIVVHVPGHTDGSIALYIPARALLFTGDAAASLGRPIVGVFNVDPQRARESFRRLAGLEFEAACFGHGSPITKGAAEAMRRVAEFL